MGINEHIIKEYTVHCNDCKKSIETGDYGYDLRIQRFKSKEAAILASSRNGWKLLIDETVLCPNCVNRRLEESK